MTTALTEEAPMVDSELIQEIQKYLTEFDHDLLDGNVVRDALLDLMLLAQKD